MEIPGIFVLLYTMYTLPSVLSLTTPLPRENWLMAWMFTIHYVYRAIISPLLLNPSMSPIHPYVWVSAIIFNTINALSIAGWLAGHGPTDRSYWSLRFGPIQVGMTLWAFGLLGNMYHDDELREIRRAAARTQKKREAKEKEEVLGEDKATDRKDQRKTKGVDKVYLLPRNGLFEIVLFPHYLCEWVEWAGFYMVGGLGCLPARNFLINEIATMTPRALAGKRWYIERFGREQVGNRKAVVPFVL